MNEGICEWGFDCPNLGESCRLQHFPFDEEPFKNKRCPKGSDCPLIFNSCPNDHTEDDFIRALRDEDIEQDQNDQMLAKILQDLEDIQSQERKLKQEEESKRLIEELMKKDKQLQEAPKVSKDDIMYMIQLEKMIEESEPKPQPREEDLKFECQICMEQFEDQNSCYPLTYCEHVFHTECLQKYLQADLSQSKLPFVCCSPNCKKELSVSDIRKLLSKEELEKYLKFSFEQAVSKQEDVSWCPTANCYYAFVFNPVGDKEFNCPQCKEHYCLSCRASFHKGQSCEQYRDSRDPNKIEQQFQEFVQGQKFKQCPFCKFWVERSAGCDHMRCRCGKEFCYKCGGVYKQCACTGHVRPNGGQQQ